MESNHRRLRGALFLVAIENLLNLGNVNATTVLWEYGNELCLVDMIGDHLEEESAQIPAHVEAVCV
jgi:hypothetical protein